MQPASFSDLHAANCTKTQRGICLLGSPLPIFLLKKIIYNDMSRYEELCHIYSQHRQTMKAYQESSVGFAEALIAAIQEDLGVTNDKISYRDHENKRFVGHPRPYIRLANDSYFHLRFGIKLEEGPRQFPKEDFVQDIRFKKTDPKSAEWLVELPQGQKFSIDMDNGEKEFHEITDILFKLISDFYRYYLTQFLSPEPNVNPIGFKVESLKEED